MNEVADVKPMEPITHSVNKIFAFICSECGFDINKLIEDKLEKGIFIPHDFVFKCPECGQLISCQLIVRYKK